METIKKFGLGYSPQVWDAFSKEALGKGYKVEFLEGTGLTIVKEDKNVLDRFRARVMFPIQSMSGRTLGFGGRILTNDKKAAKYLNSPESELYHKSKVLYGIFHAKQAIAKQNNCYLVEGYTDVIQFHQTGIENTVASSGTALSSDQIRLINRLTKNITVLFDGDAAGLRASLRGIDMILEEGMNVRVCGFPDGEDPDSFAKKYNFEQVTEYLEANSKDFIQFKASLFMTDAKNDPVKKADLIREIVVSISKVPDRIQREVYVQECSRIMDISEQVLVSTLAQIIQKNAVETGKTDKQGQQSFEVVREQQAVNTTQKVDIQNEIERKIIQILLLYGTAEEEFEDVLLRNNEEGEVEQYTEKRMYKVYDRVYLSLQEDEVELANPLFLSIYNNIMLFFRENEVFSTEHYLMQLPQELAQEVTDVLMDDERVALHNWEAQNIVVKEKSHTIGQYVSETILTLRWFLVDKIIEELKKEISPEPEADNSETLSMAMDYYKLIGSFSSKLGRVMSRYHN
jgi:DNA primase